jgi:MYXO-CTERM domain-containing protein
MRTMEERQEQPHDVLAAEEFGIGTRDDRYPGDPAGIQEPHDVLAAEEFAMPAPGDVAPGDGVGVRNLVPPILMVALVALLVLRRRRS